MNDARVRVCHAVKLTLEFFVATALWAVNESIEMPFFRGLDEHFFALQTIFGVLHVRCGNFSRRICDGAQPSTTPRRKCCQPPGRRSFNEGGTDDSQLRKGAWLPRSFTLSTINIPPSASAA